MFIKSTIEHTLFALCHDANASLEEINRRLGLYMSVNPMGPDVSIQMHTFIFSSSDGRAVLNTVNHLKWMVSRVSKLVDIGGELEKIVGVLTGNMTELHKLRSLLSGVALAELPELPSGDYEMRVRRTRGLLDAVRRVLTPGDFDFSDAQRAETVDVDGVFDHGRFFFQGKYPVPPTLEAGTAEFVARALVDKFGEEAVRAIRVDEIIGTVEYVLKFYTMLMEQIERVVTFASSVFDSYSTVGTTASAFVAAPTPTPSSLQKSGRDFSHVQVPVGAVRNSSEDVRTGTGAGAGAGAGGSESVEESDVEDDAEAEEAGEAPPSRKRRRHRKALPKPLGFEPEGATTTSASGKKKVFPKPQLLSISSMLMHCIQAVGYRAPEKAMLKAGGIIKVVERLPLTNVVRMRLEEYYQQDFRERYLPALAKILVNYSYADVPRNMKRVTDIGERHSDLLRMLYLEEHQRVSRGGAKPSFEELVSASMDLSGLDGLFSVDDLREHLDVLFV
jgi:hypothetical protein